MRSCIISFSWVFGMLINSYTLFAEPDSITKYIMVDQFGYRNQDIKVAVIVDPQIGYNQSDSFIPGSIYEVRNWETDEAVYSDTLEQWKHGAIDFSSGDRGWWFDFSAVRTDGDYYIYDKEQNIGSYKFRISADVYNDVLKQAMRVFYYQRINDPKELPYAEEPWIDASAFIGKGQDSEARYIFDMKGRKSEKDLSGGWMDAGDYNKYVTFAATPVHLLLTAYQQNSVIFSDDYNIPESKNGIPDIIDEIQYELNWIKKMQQEDGGVLIKVGNLDFNTVSPPSADKRPRYYGPVCSSSTIATAGMFAHASYVLSKIPGCTSYADDLRKRALEAWQWYQSNPKSDSCDNHEIKSGDADRNFEMQDEMEVIAAIYLFAVTSEPEFNNLIRRKYLHTSPFHDNYLSFFFTQISDALLYYTLLPGADKEVCNYILWHRKMQSVQLDLYRNHSWSDLYRAYLPVTLYTWGSNTPRGAIGSAAIDIVRYSIAGQDSVKHMQRALDILHYFHGVNPLGITYISNMYDFGGDYCADSIWHDWFKTGTDFKDLPPPGYIPGGPNARYHGNRMDLLLQPPQKCYQNWNRGFPENSWEMTEPSIYNQAVYIKLLSNFIQNKP